MKSRRFESDKDMVDEFIQVRIGKEDIFRIDGILEANMKEILM